MNIKLIALDMDGTLLTSDNKIAERTKDVLIRIQKMGIKLVLASGRSYYKLMDYAKELKMEEYGGYLVEINGIAFYDLEKQERVIKAQMQPDQIHEIFRYFSKWDVEVIANLDDTLYDYNPQAVLAEKAIYRKEQQLAEDYPWTGGAFNFLYDNRKGYPYIYYVSDPEEIQVSANKVCITHHAHIIKEVSEIAKRELEDRYWVGLTTPKWLEIMLPGITKASGLRDLGKHTHIKMEEMMAFGDGENDIEMLSEVGCGIAMINGMDSLKEIAKFVTEKSNNEDGIALTLENFFQL